MEFARKNKERLFPTLKNPTANVLSPGGVADARKEGMIGAPADTDQSWTAVRCMLSLLKAITSAIDIK